MLSGYNIYVLHFSLSFLEPGFQKNLCKGLALLSASGGGLE